MFLNIIVDATIENGTKAKRCAATCTKDAQKLTKFRALYE